MSITEFVESPGYKKVMGKVYGLGASVVILGALWKILHLPGASYMLIAGLGTEAIIFALSAFEPPHEMPDWSLVYPELVGLEPKAAHHGGGGGGGSELQALIQTGNIDQQTVTELADGIKKLGTTSSQLADLSDASLATQSYLKNIQTASESVGKFGNIQDKSTRAIEESTQALTQSYTATANAISHAGTKVANDMAQSGKQLIETYANMSKSMEQEMSGISDNSKKYNNQLADLNGNLASINSIYELQLKGSQTQLQSTENVNQGLGEIHGYLKQSVEEAKNYRDQVSSLNKTVGELNTIYGNMLSAMNAGGR
ncbi:gliding motility-associated protein GldL [Saccharicrinis carchari]|uniref:Gliding motility-associated protein GldL n=1 Tax=Saccharicrinis carchari TaxID=1168039 RepID=A0A521CUJ2_SACCC|nr:gliding motility protein GldL [Saccharicrinis carchari]SMO62330.1 gliding motility-associated protein GldL [Saccharicrinis carchari]